MTTPKSAIINTIGSFVGSPVLYPDSCMTAGSVGMFDFLDTACYPSQSTPALSQPFLNLISGHANAVGQQGSTPYGNIQWDNGLYFPYAATNARNTYVQLPADWILPSTNGGFTAGIWIKHKAQTPTTGTGGVAGVGYQYTVQNQWSLRYNFATGLYVANINGVALPGFALAVGEIANIVFAYDKVNGLAKLYKNKVLLGTVTVSTTLNTVTNTAWAQLASYPGEVPGSWNGNIYRVWLDDFGVSGISGQTLAARDYSVSASRFV